MYTIGPHAIFGYTSSCRSIRVRHGYCCVAIFDTRARNSRVGRAQSHSSNRAGEKNRLTPTGDSGMVIFTGGGSMPHSRHELKPEQECLGRRSGQRFSLNADVRYNLVGKPQTAGRGHTVNLSRNGVLFESEQALAPGALIELSIAWPVMLNQETSLLLWASGRTVRVLGNRAAVKFSRYEFRTGCLAPTRKAVAVATDRAPAASQVAAAS